jgi:plastocyanin domain-containing protein
VTVENAKRIGSAAHWFQAQVERNVKQLQGSRVLAGLCCAWLIISLTGCESVPSVGNASSADSSSVAAVARTQRVAISASAGKFEPAVVHLVRGVPAVLEFTRVVESRCMQAVRMPWMEEAVDLPMNEMVEIPVDTSMTGVFSYSCWMNMVSGEVVIDEADE